MVGQRPLILASASPRRRDLLRERGVSFEVIPAHAEETVESTPEATVMGNARRKAIAIAEQRPEALVLGVDTEVWFGGKIFGKPSDMDDAIRMLKELNGRAHEVYSGVCFVWNGGANDHAFVDVTRVTFIGEPMRNSGVTWCVLVHSTKQVPTPLRMIRAK